MAIWLVLAATLAAAVLGPVSQALATESPPPPLTEAVNSIAEGDQLPPESSERIVDTHGEPMSFKGGYVQHHPHVYVIFWGSDWNNQSTARELILNLYKTLPGSNYGAILTQYFDYSGPISNDTALTSFTDTRSAHPGTSTETNVREEVQYAIGHNSSWKAAWEAPNRYENQYVVFTPPLTTNKATEGCGYHGWMAESWQNTFTYIPWPEGGPEGCQRGLSAGNTLQVIASHEWAETATDPVASNDAEGTFQGLKGWAWGEGGEIGDICQTLSAAEHKEIASNVFAQTLYDNYLLAANGTPCVASDPTPQRYTVGMGPVSVSTASHNAMLWGQLSPAGWTAGYRFELTGPGGTTFLPNRAGKEQIYPYFPPSFENAGNGPELFQNLGPAVLTEGLKGNTTYGVRFATLSPLTLAAFSNFASASSALFSGSTTFTTPDWRPQITGPSQGEVKVGHATLSASINPEGYGTTYRFEWGKVSEGFNHNVPVPDADIGSGTGNVALEQKIEGLKSLTEYQYRIYAENQEGSHTSSIQTFTTPDWRPIVGTESQDNVKAGHATLHGHVNPNGFATHYHFEWGTKAEFEAGEYSHSLPVPDVNIGSGESNVNVEQTMELKGATTYHYRLVAESEQGRTNGNDKYFTSPFWEPKMSGIGSMNVESEEATLVARINPSGFATTYHFEWANQKEFEEGKYGHVLPIPDEALGSGEAEIEKSVVLRELKPRATYYFRVFAQNAEGSQTYGGYEFSTGSGGFRASAYPATLKATPTTSLIVGLGSFGAYNCTAPALEGSLKAGKESFENGAEILKTTTTTGSFICTSSFGSFNVAMNGCGLEFEPTYGESSTFAGELDIGPPGCGPIVMSNEPICKASIPSQVGRAVAIVNEGTGSSEMMQLNLQAQGLRFTDEGGFCGTGPHGDGTLSGSWRVQGGAGFNSAGVYAVPFFEIGPEVGTEAASEVSPSSAILHGTIDTHVEKSSWGFEYGKTTSYENGMVWGEAISAGQKGALKEQLSVSGLKPNTTYHFRMVGQSEDGLSRGHDETFTTAPFAETGEATNLQTNTATLHGTVYPLGIETSYQFEYGPTTAYGSKAPASFKAAGTASEVAVSEAIKGLSLATTYHYRLVATNAEGTAYGQDRTFATWGTWSTNSTPNPPVPAGPVGEAKLEGVSCYSASMCVAVGENKQQGKAYAQWWNGSSWSASKSQEGFANGSRYGVACVSANVCQIVGTSSTGTAVAEEALVFGNELLVGAANKAANPEGAGNVVLRDISCTASSACTAVGSYEKEGKTKTLAERWNGTSWSIQTTPNPETGSAMLWGVSCTSATSCWAVGKNEANIYAMSWNGTSWSISTLPKPSGATSAGLQKVSCPSTTSCMAVGSYYNGTAWKTLAERWNGSTWSVSSTPNPSEAVSGAFVGSFLTGVSCTSANSCTATGRYVTAVKNEFPTEEKTLVESWGGSEWQIQSSPNPEGKNMSWLSAVSCTSSTSCKAVGWAKKSSTGEIATLGERYE
jgi:hypothetical protein